MAKRRKDYREVVELLIGKILLEPDFLDKMRADPETMLKEIGVEEPTKEMIEAVREIDLSSLHRAATAFGIKPIAE